MSYQIEFTPSAARVFKKLPGPIQGRIAPRIDALAINPRPHGVEKMAGHDMHPDAAEAAVLDLAVAMKLHLAS